MGRNLDAEESPARMLCILVNNKDLFDLIRKPVGETPILVMVKAMFFPKYFRTPKFCKCFGGHQHCETGRSGFGRLRH